MSRILTSLDDEWWFLYFAMLDLRLLVHFITSLSEGKGCETTANRKRRIYTRWEMKMARRYRQKDVSRTCQALIKSHPFLALSITTMDLHF